MATFTKTCPTCRNAFDAPRRVYIYCSSRCSRTRVPLEERFWAKVEKRGPDDCWLWTGGIDRNGYGTFRHPGGRLAHRYSWILHNGPLKAGAGYHGTCVLHDCDKRYPVGDLTNRRCVNPGHLFAGTAAINNADRKAKGRGRHHGYRGEQKVGQAKLTDDAVMEIRASGETYKRLAERFGVSKSHIYRIRARTRWNHV